MGAIISPCGQYRYILDRPSDLAATDEDPALFIMLNPSTADASADDPTIRRCRGFSKAWGLGGIVVANLYALRATNPKELWLCSDPVGPLNDAWLRNLADEFKDVIFAWGANAKKDRVSHVVDIFSRAGVNMWCLGITKSGAPKHPLYIPADQKLIRWLDHEH